MSIQAAKLDLLSLTDFQKEIHMTDNVNENIISTFYRSFIKSTWYTTIPLKLQCTMDGDELIYTVNNSFHFLMYSYMTFQLPQIKIKNEYKGKVRIAWCHNIATNPIKSAVFKEDDDTYHSWDNVWADIYFQFYQDSGVGKIENHNIGMGNIKFLEEWSENLPRYTTNVNHPWFYSHENALAFPIFYKNSLTRAEHRYSFNRKVLDFLRVQILDKNKVWKDTVRKIYQYVDINPNLLFKTPELWGRYAYITDKEIEWFKCRQNNHFYIKDIVVCDTPNPNKYKSIADINLHSENPCLAMFWVAENRDATLLHNYSNYTTNTQDLYRGWDPIKSTTLKYGTTLRLDNMSSDHFSIAEPRKHFKSSPLETGYHAYSFANDSTNFHGDIGIVFANMNAKLQCRIENNNIFSQKDDDDLKDENDETIESITGFDEDSEEFKLNEQPEEPSPSFITRSRLVILRKFSIVNDDKYYFTIK